MVRLSVQTKYGWAVMEPLDYSRVLPPMRFGKLGITSFGAALGAWVCIFLAALSETDSTMTAFMIAVPVLGFLAFILGLIAIIGRRKRSTRGLWMAIVGMSSGILIALGFIA